MDLTGVTLGGRYRVERRLGEGGMGSVYLASDSAFRSRRVVVKIPHPDLLRDAQFRARFQSEIDELVHLEHPRIIHVYDTGEHEGIPYLVVQYVAGGDLRGRMPQGQRQDVAKVFAWLAAIAEALDFVHVQRRVHRDVKPGNILFDGHGNPYLSDFGIATVMRSAEDTGSQQPTQLTQLGSFVGSPMYSPPEALERVLSPQYDQYSLAVVVYEALSGGFPHTGKTATEVMTAKLRADAKGLGELVPDLGRGASQAVMRALSLAPEGRFATCTEFMEAFRQGCAQVGVPTRGAPSEAPTVFETALAAGRPGAGRPAAARGWRAPALAGAALLLLGLAGYALFGVPRGGEEAPAAEEPSAAAGALLSAETVPLESAAGTGAEPPVRVEESAPGSAVVAPVRFRGGATPAQIAYAKSICVGDCDDEVFRSEAQRAAVAIAPLRMDETEVTNAAFARFAKETDHVTAAERRGFSYHAGLSAPDRTWRQPDGPGSSLEGRPDHPVVHVSARDAEAYCAHQGMRLPSEDEWEYFARGEEARIFPWGDVWNASAASWWRDAAGGGDESLGRAGSHAPGAGPFGHQDLAGSVWEWTSTGAAGMRILKGGSWLENNPAHLRTTVQLELEPDYSASDVGFRCVEAVEEWPIRAAGPPRGEHDA